MFGIAPIIYNSYDFDGNGYCSGASVDITDNTVGGNSFQDINTVLRWKAQKMKHQVYHYLQSMISKYHFQKKNMIMYIILFSDLKVYSMCKNKINLK